MQNLINAQNKFNAIATQFKAVKKTQANAAVHTLAKESEKTVKRFTERKTELTADELKQFSKALTQFRYRVTILVKAAETLEYAHKNDIKVDVAARNVYGKELCALDIMRGKAPLNYEQGDYMVRTVEKGLQGDPIESEFTLTAGQIASICGAKSIMQTSTQPYAIMHALELVKAGTMQLCARGDNWKTSKFTFNPESDFIKAVNKL